MDKKNSNSHAGHRQRMRERYYQQGIDHFAEHEVLEMLLYACVVRQNTNELAHRLIDRFGTLARVIDAPLEELRKVEGVGETTAFFLHALPDFFMRYECSRQPKDCTLGSEDIVPYMHSFFIGRKNECVTMLLLNREYRVLYHGILNVGSTWNVSIPMEKIADKVLAYHAAVVYIAHNHPSEDPYPSQEDLTTTQRIYVFLKSINVTFADHLIFTQNTTVSMQDLTPFTEFDKELPKWV